MVCDVCSSPTTAEKGTGYTAEEFRRMVFQQGFQPDETSIQLSIAMGISRQEAINQWKNVLVAGSTTGWLLCPKCAARASRYMYKPAGSGMEGMGATESWNSVLTTAAASAALQNPPQQPSAPYAYNTPHQSYAKPQERLTAGYKVMRRLMAILALFSLAGIFGMTIIVPFSLESEFGMTIGPVVAVIISFAGLLNAILTGIYAYRVARNVLGWVLGTMLAPFLTPFIFLYVTRNDY
jgi:hypothetical protein